jgi:ABC-type sugar transport system ATPase subunit
VGQGAAWQQRLNLAQLEQVSRAGTGHLILGVRPEDVELLHQQAAEASPGSVYVVEPLGDRAFVDLKVGGDIVKVRVAATFVAATNETRWLRLDGERFHVFHAQTGATIF